MKKKKKSTALLNKRERVKDATDLLIADRSRECTGVIVAPQLHSTIYLYVQLVK